MIVNRTTLVADPTLAGADPGGSYGPAPAANAGSGITLMAPGAGAAPATAITWKQAKSGNWDQSFDWVGNKVPGAADDVTVAVPGTFTVTLSTAEAAHSLTLNSASATILDSGTLTVGATLALAAGTFQLDGVISGGTLSASGGTLSAHGGTLDGVTLQGPLTLTDSYLDISGKGLVASGAGGIGAGTINVGGYDGGLTFENTQTVDNAVINLSGGHFYGYHAYARYAYPVVLGSSDPTGVGATLTFGPDLTINQSLGGSVNSIESFSGTYNAQDEIINQGEINLAGANSYFLVRTKSFTNEGVIDVSAQGDFIDINVATFANTGTITLGGNDELVFEKGLTTAQLGKLGVGNGGTVVFGQFGAALDNTGATLDVGQGVVLGGTINSGTIAGAIDLYARGYKGYYGYTVTTTALDLSGGPRLTGAGGTGPGAINLSAATLFLQNSETLGNATIRLAGYVDAHGNRFGSKIVQVDTAHAGVTLTLGASLTIDQIGVSPSTAGLYAGAFAGDVIVNRGLISAAATDGTFNIEGQTFTNGGTLAVSDGATLNLQPTVLTNLSGSTLTGGTFTVNAGSTLELAMGRTVTVDDATLILDGAGSTLWSPATGGTQVTLESTLQRIGATGALELLDGRGWSSALALTNAGTIELGGGTFAPAGLTNIGALVGSGMVSAAVVDRGLIEAAAGTLAFGASVSGIGAMSIDGGATLRFAGTVASSLTATFAGSDSTLALSDPAQFAATMAGFGAGDTIDLIDIAATKASVNAKDQLVIVDGATRVAALRLSGSYAGDSFAVNPDGRGGSAITLASAAARFGQFAQPLAAGAATATPAGPGSPAPAYARLVAPVPRA